MKNEQKNVHQESKIYILPNAFTAGNLFFGFLSIVLCIQGKFNSDSARESLTQIAALITPSISPEEEMTLISLSRISPFI